MRLRTKIYFNGQSTEDNKADSLTFVEVGYNVLQGVYTETKKQHVDLHGIINELFIDCQMQFLSCMTKFLCSNGMYSQRATHSTY